MNSFKQQSLKSKILSKPKRAEHTGQYEWLGFSLSSLAMIGIAGIALVAYLGVLIFGENSITVLNKLQNDKENLLKQRKNLQSSNQKLQKEYFELKQLTNY